jgi:hypothetical protein
MEIKHMLIIYIVVIVFALLIYWFFFVPKGPQTQNQKPPTNSPATLTPQPNSAWLSVTGYSQSFETCKDICVRYQKSDCGDTTAREYCNAVIAVDLNKDGAIKQEQQGITPTGGLTCENSLRCFNVISECGCSRNTLNVKTCMSIYIEQMAAANITGSVQNYISPGCIIVSS